MSKIIDEDIKELALSLREHWKDFEGSRFLVTGAGGFLGKYMVLVLRHLNEHVLEKKLSALLLDNFVTGYDQQILSDERIQFKRHDVTKTLEV